MKNTSEIQEFKETVYTYYQAHARLNLPWRNLGEDGKIDPYLVMVSEIMLQQTQVQRVVPKFNAFIRRFPSVSVLADSSLKDVLIEWSGLGYNRRAKFLHQAAEMIQTNYGGVFPKSVTELEKLPGVGKNTAAAIVVYSLNIPVVFIETNIRSVYLHHFFQDKESVSDKELLPIIEATLDQHDPRRWYWALMDYGTYVKATAKNPSRRSKHHTKQTKFIGSNRQVRGQILKSLMNGQKSYAELKNIVNDPRLKTVLADLENEQLISKANAKYSLGK